MTVLTFRVDLLVCHNCGFRGRVKIRVVGETELVPGCPGCNEPLFQPLWGAVDATPGVAVPHPVHRP